MRPCCNMSILQVQCTSLSYQICNILQPAFIVQGATQLCARSVTFASLGCPACIRAVDLKLAISRATSRSCGWSAGKAWARKLLGDCSTSLIAAGCQAQQGRHKGSRLHGGRMPSPMLPNVQCVKWAADAVAGSLASGWLDTPHQFGAVTHSASTAIGPICSNQVHRGR